MTKLLRCVLVSLITVTCSFGQNSPAADPIKGVWRLNVAKSSINRSAPESEVITVVKPSNTYKFTFDIKQANGYNPKYDFVTTMKAEPVKPVYADGTRSSDTWYFTRLRANSFDMELRSQFGGWTDHYEVNADGKTMTLHRDVPKNNPVIGAYIEKDGTVRKEPQYVLVFDRVE